VEALLIDDPPILSGTKLDQKGMDERTIFSIEIEPETAADANERLVVLGQSNINEFVVTGQSTMNAGRKEGLCLTHRGLCVQEAQPGA
jgi:hypothetical protein